MRRIKFRAWDKKHKEMVYNVGITSTGRPCEYEMGELYEWDVFEDDYILMQYTGLKDIRGEKIYEGDICKKVIGSTDDERPIVVVGDKPIVVKFHNGLYNQELIDNWHDGTFVILGNIYENPELLGGQIK